MPYYTIVYFCWLYSNKCSFSFISIYNYSYVSFPFLYADICNVAKCTYLFTVVQEQFCFGGEITDEVTSFESLPVNITRKRPACNRASVTLSLSFEDGNGTTFSESNDHYT